MAKKEGISEVVTRYNNLIAYVQGLFLEKEEAITLFYHAMAIGEHCVVYGKPGRAKSKAINTVMASVKDANVYKRLIDETLLPKDLVGQIDIAAYTEKGDYKHLIEGYLPWAHLVSLEEGFNGNGFTLNALNMICNEREFNNGRHLIRVPLISAFIPTNYEPDEQIAAFYDRFLYRYIFSDFKSKDSFLKFIMNTEEKASSFIIPEEMKVGLQDLLILRSAIETVKFDTMIAEIMANLRQILHDKHALYVSPRRWDCSKRAMRISALLNGIQEVSIPDVKILKHILWNTQTQREAIEDEVSKISDPYSASYKKLNAMFVSLNDSMEKQLDGLSGSNSTTTFAEKGRVRLEAVMKIKEILKELTPIKDKSPELGKLFKKVTKFYTDQKSQLVA